MNDDVRVSAAEWTEKKQRKIVLCAERIIFQPMFLSYLLFNRYIVTKRLIFFNQILNVQHRC